MISVITAPGVPDAAGQLVMVLAQEVTVWMEVAKTVRVVKGAVEFS